jgi:hypothetical protein
MIQRVLKSELHTNHICLSDAPIVQTVEVKKHAHVEFHLKDRFVVTGA